MSKIQPLAPSPIWLSGCWPVPRKAGLPRWREGRPRTISAPFSKSDLPRGCEPALRADQATTSSASGGMVASQCGDALLIERTARGQGFRARTPLIPCPFSPWTWAEFWEIPLPGWGGICPKGAGHGDGRAGCVTGRVILFGKDRRTRRGASLQACPWIRDWRALNLRKAVRPVLRPRSLLKKRRKYPDPGQPSSPLLRHALRSALALERAGRSVPWARQRCLGA